MALSAIALSSRALLKLGAAGIASFEEGTAESELAANLYPPTRDALLSAHPWNFATGQARLPRLGVWSVLAPPGWRLRGSVQADIAVSGTRSDPRLAGPLVAENLALRSVVDGIALRGGRLRARLEGQRLAIEEFLLFGAGPEGGRVSGSGVRERNSSFVAV